MKRFRDGTPDVFDLNSTNCNGYWQDLLVGNNLEYYKNKKNLTASIEYMTPREYYEECIPILNKMHGSNNTFKGLVESRNVNPDYIKQLESFITEKHGKFPICVLDKSDNAGQEGLHRMLAISNLYGWDTYEFPVLVVKNYKQINPEKELERIINNVKSYEIGSIDKITHMLDKALINSIFSSDFNVEISDDEAQVIVTAVYKDKDYVAYVNTNEFNIKHNDYHNEDKEISKLLKEFDL
jgi:hypothetical protein